MQNTRFTSINWLITASNDGLIPSNGNSMFGVQNWVESMWTNMWWTFLSWLRSCQILGHCKLQFYPQAAVNAPWSPTTPSLAAVSVEINGNWPCSFSKKWKLIRRKDAKGEQKLGSGFKCFLIFTPFREDEPILTSICFKGVGSTTNEKIPSIPGGSCSSRIVDRKRRIGPLFVHKRVYIVLYCWMPH